MSNSASAFADLVERRILGDRILAYMRAGNVRLGVERWVPSAIDLAAAAMARSVATNPPVPKMALVFPRGHNSVAFIIGLHLALGRLPDEQRASYLPTGSVLLATTDLELRRLAFLLRAESALVSDAIQVHRLGLAGNYVDLHSGRRGELNAQQRFLLLHLPYLRPHLPSRVTPISVVDACTMSRDGWEATYQ